ncbi:charged multivesicular body protein 4b-like isoform X1 [Macrobrachium rosenbergii]|uniref:charged multivesicular body protein 4b-like isoform X1 n=1 Tax=Macrobrachium rosenbergii TaxID=79674 RepID=UPI0034D76AC8
MSIFKKKLGHKKKDKHEGPTTGEAIHKLRDTEELLVKKQEYLESKIQKELATAKQNATKNKRVAMQALKRKKKYEQQLQQIDGTLSTLEFQREALESASTNTSVLQTMGMAAKSLKAAHQHMDVDKVHDMMDDIAEQQDLAKEITEAISGGLAFGNDVDEDDLLAELEELEQENLDEQLLDTGALPSVPTAALPSRAEAGRNKKDKERDQDFAELEAWAS